MTAETSSTSDPIASGASKSMVPGAQRYQFGVFEVDLRTGELRKQGAKIKLQEKPFQLLVILLERAGRITRREELQLALWPAGTFVDFDANLKTALSKLRQALGDSAENPVFIETIPRQGYRFLAPVVSADNRSLSAASGQAPAGHSPEILPAAATAPAAAARTSWLLPLVAGLLAVVVIALYLARPRPVPGPAPGPRSVVLLVLPFDNLSGDPTQEYFSDGLTDEMITLLGHQYPKGLAVIARTSAMRYRGTQEPLTQIARELGGVDYVLEGSVRRAGNHVGINAQLFRTQDQASLWAESYESQVTDLLTVQQDVAGRIARSLVPRLAPAGLASSPSNPDARIYDSYLMGLYEANRRTEEGMRKGIEYFRRTIQDAPGYAPAYAGLANSYLVSAGWLTMRPADAYPRAKAAALQALALDQNLAEAHATLAEVEHEYEWQWAGAEREFQRALELNPNSAVAHKTYAEFLMHGGRSAEAIAEIEHARDLDPLSLIVNSLVGFVYAHAGQYDRAVQEYEKVIKLDPQFAPAHYFFGGALLREQRFDEAISQFQAAKDLTDGASMMAAALAHAYAVAGRRDQALQSLHDLQQNARHIYVSPYGLAQVYAGLGDRSRALDALERAANEHSFELMFLNIDHSFDGLRQEPRFQQLVKRIGFPS